MNTTLALSLVTSAIGMAVSGASGNVVGVALSGAGMAKSIADYNNKASLMFEKLQSTAGGSMNNLYLPLFPRLRVTKSTIQTGLNYSDFRKTHGGMCRKQKTLSSLTGFTIISNPILSGFDSAMEEEKNIIIVFMKTGIIL